VRRNRAVWFFTLPLLVLLLAASVGVFAGQSRADSFSFRFAVVADSRRNHNNPSSPCSVNSKGRSVSSMLTRRGSRVISSANAEIKLDR
jgi:hypothetical protein